MLTRYWFEFEKTQDVLMRGCQFGCGVTAFDYSDALGIISGKVFKNIELPNVQKCIKDIDIKTLDSGHIVPNMWLPNHRGIWYSFGYHDNM